MVGYSTYSKRIFSIDIVKYLYLLDVVDSVYRRQSRIIYERNKTAVSVCHCLFQVCENFYKLINLIYFLLLRAHYRLRGGVELKVDFRLVCLEL